ncbi:MAG: AprI/Inh family metalloprotease inhibitor, partial [Beijerinckiaceae bacterium]
PPSAQPSSPAPVERVVEPRPQAARSGSTALVGTWTARDGTGSTCRMTLSSTPSLDLNRASASGCANKDLARVNAWKQDGGEVYLYAAGTVVARMPASSMSGVITRSGAPLNLSR